MPPFAFSKLLLLALPFLEEEAEEFLLSPMVGIPDMVLLRYFELVRLRRQAPGCCWGGADCAEFAPALRGAARRADVEAEAPTWEGLGKGEGEWWVIG